VRLLDFIVFFKDRYTLFIKIKNSEGVFFMSIKVKAKVPDCYKNTKIKIPRHLFYSTVSLLEDMDTDDFEPDTMQIYGYIINAFNNIKADLEFTEAYVKFINAEDVFLRFKDHMNCELTSYDEDNLPF
jgi:hypothetical protein